MTEAQGKEWLVVVYFRRGSVACVLGCSYGERGRGEG